MPRVNLQNKEKQITIPVTLSPCYSTEIFNYTKMGGDDDDDNILGTHSISMITSVI